MHLKKILLAVTIISMVVTVNAVSDQKLSGQSKTDFRSANMYINEGIYEKALPLYLSVLEEYPDNVETLEKVGGIYFDVKNDFFSAYDYFKKGVDAITAIYAEHAILQNTDPDEAKKFYKKVISKNDLEEKQKHLQMLKDSCWIKIFKDGQTKFDEQDYDEAINTFTALMEIAPDSVKTIKMLAYCYNSKGDSDKTMEYFIKVAQIDEQDEIVRQQIANTYFENGNYDEALKWFTAASEIHPENPDNYFNLAIVYNKQEDHAAAFSAMAKAVEYDPDNMDAILSASNYAAAAGLFDESYLYLEKAIALQPDNIDYLSFLSYKLFQAEQYEKMIEYAKMWYELDNNSKEAAQLVYQGAKKIGDKPLETKFETILRNMQ